MGNYLPPALQRPSIDSTTSAESFEAILIKVIPLLIQLVNKGMEEVNEDDR